MVFDFFFLLLEQSKNKIFPSEKISILIAASRVSDIHILGLFSFFLTFFMSLICI